MMIMKNKFKTVQTKLKIHKYNNKILSIRNLLLINN